MSSLYLARLTPQQRSELISRLHDAQRGSCFICEDLIDLTLHANAMDIDHVIPLQGGGRDDPDNFALAHSSCNRSKQASDLRVARVLARFSRIREKCTKDDHGANLNDVLAAYGGAKHELSFSIQNGSVRYTLGEVGDNSMVTVPLYKDDLSDIRYFFVKLPIAYLHHDDRINPRDIGSNLGGLVEEFHRQFPQLHVALAWVSSDKSHARVRVFDGQHKAAAQVLLGVSELPVRIFVDPDPDRLLTANTHAGTSLRQVAFDKSVQRRLGSSLFADRLNRYRQERGLPEDAEDFSERDLVRHFKLESREMKRYVLDMVRAAITHHPDNQLKHYVEFGGKGQDKPLSYSTVEKTFLSFFIYPDVLETPLNYRSEQGLNPRDLEVVQVVRLMNIVAEEIYIGKFELDLGTQRIEHRVQKGEPIPEPHLVAHRLSREEILYVWLGYVRQIVQNYFITMAGKPIDDKKLFQYQFPEPLWERVRAYVGHLRRLPVWVNRDLSQTVFGGKQNYEYWKTVFVTGKAPTGQQVLAEPINLMKMIEAVSA
jgi:hypothetical protein